MKLRTHIIIFISLLLVNFAICYFCSDEIGLTSKQLPEKIKFKSADKEEVLVIKSNSASGTTKLEINLDNNSYELKAKYATDTVKLDKIKYKATDEDGDKSLYASVKFSSDDDDFKLIDAEDKLMWKVKVSYDKIKISDNEEGDNPFVIKRSSKKSKVKVKVYDRAEQNIAVVKLGDNKVKVKKVLQDQEEKEDLYSTKDIDYQSKAMGVLALTEIPARARAIIVTELIRKGE